MYRDGECIHTTGYVSDIGDNSIRKGLNDNSFAARFQEVVKSLGVEKWAIHSLLMTPSIQDLVEGIKDGTTIGVSDGSFKDNFGTACWILENASGTERIVGLVEVPGFSDEHDAYRSELAGLYGLILAVKLIVTIGSISSGSIEIGCDGLSALNRGFDTTDDDISSKHSHFDILSGILGMRRAIPIQWKTRHIKGHHDDDKEAILDN